MANQKTSDFDKVLGAWDILVIAFGAMIGWGWVVSTGDWINAGGVLGAALGFVIGGIMIFFVGLTYAELTAAMPQCGGEHVFSHKAMGPIGSFICTWAIVLGYVSVACFEACALPTIITYIYPPFLQGYLYTVAGFDVYASWLIVAVVVALLIMWINIRGVKAAANLQTILTVIIGVCGILLIVASVFTGDSSNLQGHLFNNDIGVVQSVFQVALVTPFFFIGFDVIPQASEEMDIPLKQIGFMVIFAITLGALWYIGMCLAVGFAAPMSAIENSTIPLADAAAMVFGSKIFAYILIVAGIGGIITSWNAMFMGSTRILFAMGRAKLLPAVFAKKSKYNTPSAAILLSGIVGIVAPFLGKNAISWFMDASSLGTVVAYLCVAISFFILHKKEPDLQRPLRLKAPRVIGVLGVLSCIFFISLYMPFGSSALTKIEWGMIACWVVLGIILMLINKKNKVTKRERELLIFGEEYARPAYLKDESFSK